MDQPNNEEFLLCNSNVNLENIRKTYGKGGISMAEILDGISLGVDFETMATAADTFIPHNLLTDTVKLEGAMKDTVKVLKPLLPSPFCPGKVFFVKDKDSALNKFQQAACLTALKLKQNGVGFDSMNLAQQTDVILAGNYKYEIQEENTKFLEYAQKDWSSKQYKRALSLKAVLKDYAYVAWKKKLKEALKYPQFYKPLCDIPMSCPESESNVSISLTTNLYELGTVAKFVAPCLEWKHVLRDSTLPVDDTVPIGSKLSVSEDPNIINLINTKQMDIDVVISSSGLKQLMDNSETTKEWCIPVVVKAESTKTGEKEKTVVYVNKPMAKQYPSPIDFKYYCAKKLIKTNFCCYPGFSLNADEDKELRNGVSDINAEYLQTKYSRCKTKDYEDELLQLLDVLEKRRHDPFIRDGKFQVYHNVSYRVWNMKPNNNNELLKSNYSKKSLNVLVRCKLDACERLQDGSLQPLVIVPKVEYQLEHGANVPTKKEIIDQWTALFFRPFSNLYRIRMQSTNTEIVDVQRVSLQSLNTEATTFYNYKPHLRLDALYQIFSELTNLSPGNYVLCYSQQKGPFIKVLEESDSASCNKKFSIYQAYSEDMCRYIVPTKVPWTPIDVTYILPVHNTFKRMPGLFRPLIKANNAKKNKKLNKKNKNKKKTLNKNKEPES